MKVTFCALCNKELQSSMSLAEHVIGKKHLKNEAKAKGSFP